MVVSTNVFLADARRIERLIAEVEEAIAVADRCLQAVSPMGEPHRTFSNTLEELYRLRQLLHDLQEFFPVATGGKSSDDR